MQPALRWLWLVLASLALLACSSTRTASATSQNKAGTKASSYGAYFQKDGPPSHLPVSLDRVPDAVPRIETPIAGANQPYQAFGVRYVPSKERKAYSAVGRASWYGKQFHGRKTASGEPYNMFDMTAAHPTLPIPSYVRVTNIANGKQVIVRVNDRGPFHAKRLMDLSYAAAHRLGIVQSGSAQIRAERVWPGSEPGEVVTSPPGQQQAQAKPNFIKVGSYGRLAAAEAAQRQLGTRLPAGTPAASEIVRENGRYLVQVGPFRSVQAAQRTAAKLDLPASAAI